MKTISLQEHRNTYVPNVLILKLNLKCLVSSFLRYLLIFNYVYLKFFHKIRITKSVINRSGGCTNQTSGTCAGMCI